MLLGWRFSLLRRGYGREQEDLMGRPIIGITGELDAARWGDWLREAVISPVSYIRAVDRAGGAPVVLPPVPPPSVAAFIATLDGLVFAGGRDLDPANYDQERADDTDEPEHRRDRFELALMRAALDGGVPFLAVGRGLHVLTVARGGTLTQDLPGHRTDRARYAPHDVALGADSFLGGLLGTRIMVPAAHHQAPYRLGEGVAVGGWAPGGEGGRGPPVRRRRPLAPRGERRPAPVRRACRGRGRAPDGSGRPRDRRRRPAGTAQASGGAGQRRRPA